MMSKIGVLLMVMAFVVFSLVACGISADVHYVVVAEKEAIQASVTQLEKDKETAEASVAQLEKDKEAAGASVAQLKKDKEAIQASVAQLEEENKSAIADLMDAQANVQDLKAVHPPKRFKNRSEIETWLRNDDMSERAGSIYAESWLSKALEQQARALQDGYLVSADYVGPDEDGVYVVWLSAVAENLNYFSWDPESDEIIFGANVNPLPLP